MVEWRSGTQVYKNNCYIFKMKYCRSNSYRMDDTNSRVNNAMLKICIYIYFKNTSYLLVKVAH